MLSLVELLATQMVDADDFVEMTKNYAQGIVPSTPQGDFCQEADKNATPNDDARVGKVRTREIKSTSIDTSSSSSSSLTIEKCLNLGCVFWAAQGGVGLIIGIQKDKQMFMGFWQKCNVAGLSASWSI